MKKTFGVTHCTKCGAILQPLPVYYQISKRTKTRFKNRRYKLVLNLCHTCAEPIIKRLSK